jgi:hypothetical protein
MLIGDGSIIMVDTPIAMKATLGQVNSALILILVLLIVHLTESKLATGPIFMEFILVEMILPSAS